MGATVPDGYPAGKGRFAPESSQGRCAEPAPRLVPVVQTSLPSSEAEGGRRNESRDHLAGAAPGVRRRTWRERHRRKRRWKFGLGMFLLGFTTALVVVAGVGAGVYYSRFAPENKLADVVKECGARGRGVRLAGDRTSLTMEAFGDGSGGVSTPVFQCVLERLGTPSAVRERMGETRAIDGTREESWGSYRATWTYHPDQGLHVVISAQ